jgi:membrane protein DedA with SNARE-associated domain
VLRVIDSEQSEAEPTPRSGPVWVVAFVALVVCTNVGGAIFSKLLKHHPLQLLMLSSRNRYLVLTAPLTSFAPWAVVGAVRLAAAALVCHMIGRCYGDKALRWFWKFLGMPQEQVARFEAQVAKAEWVMVPFFVGSNIVWALTGAAKTSWRRLAPMFVVGTAGRLLLLRWLAHEFRSQLLSVVNWTNKYQIPILVASVAIVVLANVRNFRKGR